MKLEIRLVDENERSIKGAELTITLVFKDGSERVLPVRKSNVRGEVKTDSISRKVFNTIDFRKSHYQIRSGKLSTPELNLERPVRVSADHFRYVLVAHKLSSETPSARDARAKVLLRANLITESGSPLFNVSVTMVINSKKGVEHELGPVTSNKDGIAEFQLPTDPDSLDWLSLKLNAVLNGRNFASIKVGPPDPSEKVWYIGVTMQAQKKPRPPQPPVSESDNADWSTGPSDSGWMVQGQVTGDGGKTLAGILIKVCCKEIGKSTKLGSATTGPNGRYRIYYEPSREDNKVNLLVRAHQGNKQVASSGLIGNAGPTEQVDFSLSDEAFAGIPLYAQIRNDTENCFKGDSPTVLDVEDVTLIAEKTNHNPVILAHYVRAWDLIEELKQGSELDHLAEPFFALTAGGLHPSLNGVLGASNDNLRTLLTEAIESRWISKLNVDDVIKQINELRKAFYQEAKSDLSKLLDAIGVAKTKKGEVIAITLGDDKEQSKWGVINSLIGAAKTNRLKDLIEVWRTLEKDATLSVFLYSELEINNIDKLVLVKKDDLLSAVQEGNEMPDQVQGRNAKEKQANYVDALFRLIEERNPHQHFLQNLAQSKVDVAQDRASTLLTKSDLNLESAESLRTMAKDEDLSELADLATLYVICPLPNRATHAEHLMSNNLLSSMDVMDWTRDKFRKAMLPEIQEEDSNAIYDKAAHLGSMTTALSIQLPEDDPNRKNTLIGQLFSDSLNGSCEHCQSTYSPSAYLLDLYRFLKKAEYGNQDGTDLLDERRPDIKQLELNCNNADTLMPYIDLSNEVLESMMMSQPLSMKQTLGHTDQLRAEPEYVNTSAYQALATHTFPWGMGYDRELDRTNLYLTHLGINFDKAGSAASIKSTPIQQVNKRFSRVFGVANPQSISLGTQARWLANWGVNNRNLLETLPGQGSGQRNLTDLSRWLQLDATQIVDLANSDFVSLPHGSIDSVGVIDWQEIDDDVLIRMQFFGRLHVVTGYSVTLLDRILKLDFMDLDTPLVWRAELSALQLLATNMQSTVDQIVALWEQELAYRRLLLAEEFGLSDESFDKLEAISGQDSSTPSSLLKLVQALLDLEEHGMQLADVLNLLASPSTGHSFSPESNLDLLSSLKAILEASQLEENTEFDDILSEWLAQTWSISNASIKISLSQFNDLAARIAANTDQGNEALLTEICRLYKLAWLLNSLDLNESQLIAIMQQANKMQWPQLDLMPVLETDTVQNLFAFIDLAEHQRVNRLHFSEQHDLFEQMGAATNTLESLISALSEPGSAGIWSTQNLSFLLGDDAFNFANQTNFIAKKGFIACSRILELVESTAGTAQQVWNAVAHNDASEAQQLLRNGVAESDYWEVLAQLNDPIRERCRKALSEIVLTQSRNKGRANGFENTHDLYEHILIDPEMSACFDTSRTKQAIASLQQLIQRIMLNLENGCAFNQQYIEQWAWRKNYRVWEANRKVFLTPENWVEPELRDNKSNLFEELETELLQGEVDNERAEATLLNYARGLLSLSRMEMVASVHDEAQNRNYVFARTGDHPRKYYWCLRDSNGLWGGWHHIDHEIEGDHVLPVMYQNRLFLFWLNLSEKVDISSDQYQQSLATIEANEEICRAEINDKNRLIQDYEDKVTEYEKYKDNNHLSMRAMWIQIIDLLNDSIEDIDEQLNGEGGLKDDLVSFKSQKDALAHRYTYFECNLSWSQFDGRSGWLPARRSVEGVNTIYIKEDEDDETHLRYGRQFWIVANPNEIDLDIELRTFAGNSDGKSYDYRLGLFEFDPVLEQVSAKDESQAPKFDRHLHFTTIWYNGQKLTAIHPLPYMKIDVDNQDQQLLSWDPDIGAAAYPERLLGYNPSHSPFLFSYQNQSYFFDPEQSALGKPLVDQAAIPRVTAQPNKNLPKVANTNFQALSIKQGSHQINTKTSPAFASGGMRKAARPLGRSTGKLADGRLSGKVSMNTRPATSNDWNNIQSVMAPSAVPDTRSVGKLANGQKWNVSVMYHPFAEIIVSELYRGGIDALYKPDEGSGRNNARGLKRQQMENDVFRGALNPSEYVVLSAEKEERFEFNRRYPYSVYNWEIFFHAPFAIAKHLTRNRKYEEAQKWLHFIFDPISRDGDAHRSSWRFKPFFNEHLRLLDGSQDEITEFAEQNFGEFEAQVAEWEQNPFNPHAVARLRTVSYMRSTYIAYLDNLLAWADDLFRRDTMESVSEAAQLYIHAAQLLGPAPLELPNEITQQDSKTLLEHDENKEQVHPLLVASGVKLPPAKPDKNDFYSKMGNFCIPANDRIREYWDTVADRLFKIRHCMNIEGVERTLALYQPPIDPAMLVRAAAAGVDLGSAIASLNAALPHYRFSYILQKAKEFAGQVGSLGGALLSALEKQDGEALSQLRSSHEVGMQKRILEIKKERIKESEQTHASLEKSLFSAMDRRDYYEGLLDQGGLNQEKDEIKKLEGANTLTSAADVANLTGAVLAMVPDTGFSGFFPTLKWGGGNLSNSASAIGSGLNARAGGLNRVAGMLARDASIVRRNMDWEFQVSQAKRDIERLEKDQLASEIRIALAEKEIADQEQQIANSQAADLFLRDKFTNEQLYGWMVGQLSALHFQAYQLALDMAKQAEACMNFELDADSPSIIEFTYWDGMRKGLLAGEKLAHDLNRLDAHYIANNDRKLELTKNVSLLRIDAGKLLELKRNAECEFTIPEYVFDLDYPGHYKRRIKSVALTIPAISGPYTTISCELSIQGSSIVHTVGQVADDSGMLADTVALSSGQNDSGMFQFDLRDERYLPFEGHGVNSSWKIALPPKAIAQFDYSTISDVILTINYTARNDLAKRGTQIEALEAADFGQTEFTQSLSIKGQFSDLWYELVATSDDEDGRAIVLKFLSQHFPYIASARGITLSSCSFVAIDKSGAVAPSSNSLAIPNGDVEDGYADVNIDQPWALDILGGAANLKDIYVLVNYSIASSN